MNELIKNADHIHYILSKALIKYHSGKQLSNEEDEAISDLYIAREENHLEHIREISYKFNIHLNKLIMSGKPGMHKKNNGQNNIENPLGEMAKPNNDIPNHLAEVLNYNDKDQLSCDGCGSYLDQKVLSLEGKFFPDDSGVYAEILGLIQNNANINGIYKYCQEKLQEKPLTVREAFKTAVLNNNFKERTGVENYEAGRLADKIIKNEDISPEELAKIREAIGNVYRLPEIVYFLWNIIDKK